MERQFTLLILTLLSFVSIAQKEDYNWTFGRRAGIDFNNLISPSFFKTNSDSYQSAASISEDGNLLLYTTITNNSDSIPSLEFGTLIYDSRNSRIIDGDSIRGNYLVTNGSIILPTFHKNQYYIFCLGSNVPIANCTSDLCLNLYFNIVEITSGNLVVVQKNIPIIQTMLEEGMTAVRHANGKDWWILTHEYGYGWPTTPCSNKFYKILLTANGPQYAGEQKIGTLHCHFYSSAGEFVFSKTGNLLAMVITGQGIVDIFDFNRCTGVLSNYRTVDVSDVLLEPYSCEFSSQSNILYVSGVADYDQFGNVGGLYQYNLNATDISGSKIALWENSNRVMGAGQLQIAPDNKIYMAVKTPDTSALGSYISVINYPDSLGLASDFRLYGFYLGDSARSTFSLPNMPNYNLGPTGIYTLKAGVSDTMVYCQDQSNGVALGSTQEDNVVYSWSPSFFLSDTTTAQPTASPTKDIWYYMTVRDTVSCNVERTDSVFVKVETCTGINQLSTQQYSYKIHPNLYNGNRIGQLALGQKEEGHVEVYDMRGTLFVSSSLTEGINTLNLNSLPKGVFIYKVYVNGEVKTNDKLVVIE